MPEEKVLTQEEIELKAAYDGDKTATNGNVKAILQVRKGGLGYLIITLRTSNVTKSIINLCITVFALRTLIQQE